MEWIEGVLIHLFYDDRIQRWELATRGCVGGKNIPKNNIEDPAKPISFRQMVLEAFHANPQEDLNDLPIMDSFDPNLSYQFILQHPRNRITRQNPHARLFLISVYKIIKNTHFIEFIPPSQYEKNSSLRDIEGIIEFPRRFHFESYGSIFDAATQVDHDGFVVVNELNGDRMTIKSNRYNHEITNKTIDRKNLYIYLCLMHVGKLSDFLNYYPKYRKEFFKITGEYKYFIMNIYEAYKRRFISPDHRTPLKHSEPIIHKKFTEKIHKEIYIPSLQRGEKMKITLKIIDEYFTKMEPRELIHILTSSVRYIK
jgi:hypothetical protein